MGIEIERKFLIVPDDYDEYKNICCKRVQIEQGYLNLDIDRTVRIRVERQGSKSKAYITVKGRNDGIKRAEFEYEIPVEDGEEMLSMCDLGTINKHRYFFKLSKLNDPSNKLIVEIDEFLDKNEGLIVAEIEFDETDMRSFMSYTALKEKTLPDFIGKEVTNDPRYYNSALIKNPFKVW